MSTFSRLVLLYCLGAFASASAATFTFRFNDDPGEGFNDPTLITALQGGNNPATTLGEARRNVLVEAGRIWGALLVSNVPIVVDVQFNPQECTATTGTLASAGARTFFRDFSASFSPDTFFASALADSLAGEDLILQTQNPNNPDIIATFNLSVDSDTNCLGGRGFYYGFDNNKGNRIDALVVALHELAHGFGFASEINLDNGMSRLTGTDGIERFSTYVMQIFDENLGRAWPMLSPAERVTSADGNAFLAWNGSNVNSTFAPLAAGVTSQRRLRLFSPTPVSPGSSVSHWTTLATPNLLMEPNISRDLRSAVDVTVCALRDIGWQTTSCAAAPSPNAPTAMSQTVTVLEDSSVAITLMATDPDPDTTLTFATSSTARGTLTGSTAMRTYTPSLNVFGADSFTFTASDGGNVSAPATVIINITPVNDPPTAASPDTTVTSGQQVSIPLGGSDVDGDPITFELVSAPANGTSSLTPGGVLTYQSRAGFSGADPFTYRVRDATTASSNLTIFINVNPSTTPVPGGRGGGGGGGTMNELLLLALGLLALSARMYKRRTALPQHSR